MGISLDLHTNEREDIRKMIEEAKQVHIDNESEDVERFRTAGYVNSVPGL